MDEHLDETIPLRGLTNIGPTIADRLAAAGLHTVGDLHRVGPAEAFLRVRAAHPQVSIPVCYYLYSLEGALRGVAWNDLDEGVKARLCAEAGVPFRAARHDTGRPASTVQPRADEPPVQRAAKEARPAAAAVPEDAYTALVTAMRHYPGVTFGEGRQRGFGANALQWNGMDRSSRCWWRIGWW